MWVCVRACVRVHACVCAPCIFMSFTLCLSVCVRLNLSSLAAAHCPAVISGLADTWDQWCGPSKEATSWQLALITFSTLWNSTLYMPLTSPTQCDPNSTILLTLYTKVCVQRHTHTQTTTNSTILTTGLLMQQLPAEKTPCCYSGIT